MAKVCFITAIYGNYEASCKKYVKQSIETDFICFTDNENINNNEWIIDTIQYHNINKSPFDNINYVNSIEKNKHTFNIAKYYKQAFQNIPRLKDYEVIIWIDGTIEIINEKTAEYILNNINKNKIIGWAHDWRNGNLVEEVNDSLKNSKYTSTKFMNQDQPIQEITKQYNDYIKDGYTNKEFKKLYPHEINIGVWHTAFCAFLNNNTEVTSFLNLWYLQTLQYTTQDQISFPYVCYKSNIIPYTLPNNEIKLREIHLKTENNDFLKIKTADFVTDFYIKHPHGY